MNHPASTFHNATCTPKTENQNETSSLLSNQQAALATGGILIFLIEDTSL